MAKVIAVIVDYKSKILPLGLETVVVDNNRINRGFAGGVNVGIKKALAKKATHILLINPDIKFAKTAIYSLLKVDSDIVSPVLKFIRDGKEILDYGGKVNWFLGRTTHNENIRGKVDYVSGACMLIRAEVFRKIGLFDQHYFMYFEDVDFCLRAKGAGFKVLVDKKTFVDHKIAEHKFSSNIAKKEYLIKSNEYFITKWVPWHFKWLAQIYILWLKTHI